MRLLAIESSCDETSAAVVVDGRVASNVVSSQVQLHGEYGGVVPELAAREHLRQLGPMMGLALAKAHLGPSDLDGVAVTRGPGLPSALSAGVRTALALGLAIGKPVVGIHHHEAHLYSPWIEADVPVSMGADFRPHVSLIASGGHTLLVHCPALFEHRVLGGTLDDAAGECFDKVAKMLGLPYPGGPQIEAFAKKGDPARYEFPRPKRNDPDQDFSFSGLKTSVRYFLRDHPGILETPSGLNDICASVQEAIVEVLSVKLVRAALKAGVKLVSASGGVVCNGRLREVLKYASHAAGLEIRMASPRFCTDNAAMVGMVAYERIKAGKAEFLRLESEAVAGLVLEAGN